MMRLKRRPFPAQGMVEFALIGPIFFLVLLGTIEMGRFMWTNHELANGTREGARWASVRGERHEEAGGTAITNADVETVILDRTTALDSSLTVNLTWSDADRVPGSKVTVTTSYEYLPMIGGFLGIGPATMSRQSELTIHY